MIHCLGIPGELYVTQKRYRFYGFHSLVGYFDRDPWFLVMEKVVYENIVREEWCKNELVYCGIYIGKCVFKKIKKKSLNG